MSRSDVYQEMKEMFGTVISFVDEIPDEFIDSEWDLIKRVQFGETLIPQHRAIVRPIGLSRWVSRRGSAGRATGIGPQARRARGSALPKKPGGARP